MNLLKNFRDNAITSPKTTKQGNYYALYTAIVTIAVTELMGTHPAAGEFVNTYRVEIYGLLTMICAKIVHYFGSKKDI